MVRFIFYAVAALVIHCSMYAGGMYQRYLVQFHEKSIPRAPGKQDTVPFLKQKGLASTQQAHDALAEFLPSTNGTLGPRASSSPLVQKLKQLWIVDSLFVSCRKDFVENLKKLPGVKSILTDERLELSYNDGEQAIYGNYPVYDEGVDQLQSQGYTGKHVRVGILDSGILAHPEFKGKISAYADFTSNPQQEYTDEHGHGTHVAGLIAGSDLSGKKIGMAPDVNLVVAKVLEPVARGASESESRQNLQAFASRLLEAMQWMLDPDGDPDTADYPNIINNSWGFKQSMPLSHEFFDNALAAWRAAGIIPVFAAGNDGALGENTIYYPATSPQVISVGALRDNQRAYFSSRGSASLRKPDFAFPGFRIFSLKMKYGQPEYGILSGTSQASPLVSGLIALMLQENPALSYEEIYGILKQTCAQGAWNPEIGFGKPESNQAVQIAIELKKDMMKKGTADTFPLYSHAWKQWKQEGSKSAAVDVATLEKSYFDFLQALYAKGAAVVADRWLLKLKRKSEEEPDVFTSLWNRARSKASFLKLEQQ
jgi:bacillopeptidase F